MSLIFSILRHSVELTFTSIISMKLDKNVVQRRLDLMAAEGVVCFISPCRIVGAFIDDLDDPFRLSFPTLMSEGIST